jgi:hypothetical protein
MVVYFYFLFVIDWLTVADLLFSIDLITVANQLFVIDSLSVARRTSKAVETRKQTKDR